MENLTPEVILSPVELRQQEINQYANNIALYKKMVESLPSEWPEHLAKYKNEPNHHQAIAEIEDLADVELVSKLWAHDAARNAIRTEMVEKAKAEAILVALQKTNAI